MKSYMVVAGLAALAGIAFIVIVTGLYPHGSDERPSEPVAEAPAAATGPSATAPAAASARAAQDHLNSYFQALAAEFPPGEDPGAGAQAILEGGTEIAQRFFPENSGPGGRALVQSLTQFAIATPEDWAFVSATPDGEAIDILVEFTVGSASMTDLGMSEMEVLFRLQRPGENWVLVSVNRDELE